MRRKIKMSLDRPISRPLALSPHRKRDVRTQFGALPWRMHKDKLQFCLISTRRTGRWIVPKGWPMDGATPAEAAAIEALEEGGLEGRISERCLGIFTYVKELASEPNLPCVVAVFPLKVTKARKTWPEMSERKRRWVSPRKAAELVQEPDLARLFRDFALVKKAG